MFELSVLATSFGLKLFSALVAFVIARLALHNLDKATGFDFEDWLNHADDKAVGTYLAGRVVAVCVLFAIIIG